jgi:hypothetical protein
MIRRLPIAAILFCALQPGSTFLASTTAQAQTAASKPATLTDGTILNASAASGFLPGAVFFRGQSASVQARNSGGVYFSKDALFLSALVDTSGYSSEVQQKYQAYLITESPVEIGGHRLAPGAYGCGFIAGSNFIVMDIGGHDLFTVKSQNDSELKRPMPLQVLAAPSAHHYRLYAGRNYVEFSQTR